jgi:ABC-type Fe3+ transport system permease subunit
LGAAAKLGDVLTDNSLVILDVLSKVVTFGGMAVLVTVICGLVLTAVAQRRGREVPSWAESLVVAG